MIEYRMFNHSLKLQKIPQGLYHIYTYILHVHIAIIERYYQTLLIIISVFFLLQAINLIKKATNKKVKLLGKI